MTATTTPAFLRGGIDVAHQVCARLDEQPLYVIGGRQRGDRSLLDLGDSWYGYGSGAILRVDGAGVSTALEYESRPGSCTPGDPILFKSASAADGMLYCCTQTEVVVLSATDLAELQYVTLPIFNDVHHVLPTGHGTMLVAISGLELVVEISPDGTVLQEWNVLGEDTWATHDRRVDYRQGVDLKPHRAHPNHLFMIGDEPFATRFEKRDAVSLVDPSRRIDLGGERVHDGVVHDGAVYFTTVDGEVVVVDAATLKVTDRHRLRPFGARHDRGSDAILGWCRALRLDGESCWVGFSRIRPTHLRQTVSWVRNRGVSQSPTRIARYRMSDWTCDAEIDLEPFGLNAVFSVVPA